MEKIKAILALEDGLYFEGLSFGATGDGYGEVVFNTAMTGYQEILTDPSYKGQIVTMTYPLIGNYGLNSDDVESLRPHVEGFVVKELSRIESNWRSEISLDEFLKKYNIVAIEGVDTRALTKHLRTYGAKRAVLSTLDLNPDSLIKKAKSSPGLIGRDLIKEVTCKEAHSWEKPEFDIFTPLEKTTDRIGDRNKINPDTNIKVSSTYPAGESSLTGFNPPKIQPESKFKVVVMDFGAKHNIARKLVSSGCSCIVVPASTTAKEILSYKPSGLVLSNGPGDPEGIPYAIAEIKKLLEEFPIFGICLGHQLLGLAFGGKTYKLKFGHHGANQPVMDLETKKVEITSQNHGFAVDIDSIPDKDMVLTHINLNDKTVEGMKHKRLPIFSVQYHPEASPGPHDAGYLFERFVKLMEKSRSV